MQAAVKKIGIGADSDAGKVIENACRVNVPFEVICYLHPDAGKVPPCHRHVSILESNEPEKVLITDLMSGAINALSGEHFRQTPRYRPSRHLPVSGTLNG